MTRGRDSWGTFEALMDDLKEAFGDPNEERNELAALEKARMGQEETADNFFQRFEILARKANYFDRNDRNLIRLLEKAVPGWLIRRVYNKETVPTTYRTYKEAIIAAHTLEQQLTAVVRPSNASSSKDAATVKPSSKKNRTASSKSKTESKKPFFFKRPKTQVNSQQEEAKAKSTDECFLCKKLGHWKKDCPQMKKIHQLRAQLTNLTDAELDILNTEESSF